MTMEPLTFTSKLERNDFLTVATVLAVRNPLSLTAMASGPVLWLAGTLAGGTMVRDFGLSLMFLIVAVPAAGVLAGAYAAYRPGASELFAEVEWEFSDKGVRIRQQGDDAFAEWGEFAGWRTVATCYLLHTAARKYVVLPRGGVPSERRDEFEALLTERVGLIR